MTSIITRDQLGDLAPSVFDPTLREGTSDSGRSIPTAEVLAREAWNLKLDDAIQPVWLLTARRDEDMTLPECSRDLWKTTNVVHEGLVRSGLTGRNEWGRRVATRPVKAVEADLRINRRPWEMVEKSSLI